MNPDAQPPAAPEAADVTATTSDRLDLVEWYAAENGWALLPLEAAGKKPRADVAKGWSGYRLTRERVRTTFAGGCNVGVLLGEPSGDLVDADLDCQEALELASLFLPDGALTFGRASRPKSHALYTSTGEPLSSLVVEDIPPNGKERGEMLVELRSTGRQTMIPPSIHPDGERVEWTADTEEPLHPQPVDGADLRRRVELLGAACLVARHHPAGLAAARAFATGTLARADLRGLPISVQAKIAELCHAPRVVEERRYVRAPSGDGWIARIKAMGVAGVAAAVGLEEVRKGSWGSCPACTNEKRGSRDRRGAIGIRRDGRGWACHACKTTGDAVSLAAWVLLGTPRPANWHELRAALEARGIL